MNTRTRLLETALVHTPCNCIPQSGWELRQGRGHALARTAPASQCPCGLCHQRVPGTGCPTAGSSRPTASLLILSATLNACRPHSAVFLGNLPRETVARAGQCQAVGLSGQHPGQHHAAAGSQNAPPGGLGARPAVAGTEAWQDPWPVWLCAGWRPGGAAWQSAACRGSASPICPPGPLAGSFSRLCTCLPSRSRVSRKHRRERVY